MALTRWRRLTLRHDVEEAGEVTWLELFFDLVFVAALIQVGDQLSSDTSWAGAVHFGGVFVLLWWIWTGTTAFMNRFAVDDLTHRVLVLLQMFAVGMLAVAAVGLGEASTWVPIGYVAARIPLLVMYARVRAHVEEARRLATIYLSAFGGSALMFLASIALPTPARYLVWAIGIVVELVAPILALRRTAPPTHDEHFRERYAVFTIIVLGETFVKTLTELTGLDVGFETVVFGGLAFVMLVALWWTYFDDVADSTLRRQQVVPVRGLANRVVWVYSHLPLAAGLTAYGVASKKLVGIETFGETVRPAYAVLLGCSLALTLLSVAMLDAVTLSPHYAVGDHLRRRLRGTAAVLALAASGLIATGVLTALVGVVVVAAIVVGQIVAEVVLASRAEAADSERINEEIEAHTGTCEHLRSAAPPGPLERECRACLEADETWVQLRVCLTCGRVACCDDSPGRHATVHHSATGHPVIATAEEDDTWAYCYEHDVTSPEWLVAGGRA